ncbi:hypothetical protein RR42_s0563 [Cupriavidus basilensis]|uniref:Uncharacterized protein n=1 Tax=Cupriavidus basilensis TaxID=68895 RepID=A0A0C4YNL7_9BURK|nr:hypothetical protein RR42_s0563 [Cupriavidus basilensis]
MVGPAPRRAPRIAQKDGSATRRGRALGGARRGCRNAGTWGKV